MKTEEKAMQSLVRAEKLHKAATKDVHSGYANTARGRVLDMDLLTLYRLITVVRDSRPVGARKIYDGGLTLRAIYDLKDKLIRGEVKDAVEDAGTIVVRLRELMEDTPEVRMGALLRGET